VIQVAFYECFQFIFVKARSADAQIAGDAALAFLFSQSVDDFGVDVHVNPLHVWCSSPKVVLGEILPQW